MTDVIGWLCDAIANSRHNNQTYFFHWFFHCRKRAGLMC